MLARDAFVKLQNSTVIVNVDKGLLFAPNIGTFKVGGLSGNKSVNLSDLNGGPVTLTVGGDEGNATFSGSIGGNGSLQKHGLGTLKLTGSNSYSGGLQLD